MLQAAVSRGAGSGCCDGYYAFDRARSYGVYNEALHHAMLLLK